MGRLTSSPLSPSTTITTAAAAMGPSTLDLFILTFNCAKNLINVAAFGAHLHAGFTQNAAAGLLPDLVVFSLQEVAPLSYSFIGSYFLNPYYARFGEALNLAATRVLDDASGPRQGGQGSTPYTLVRAKNVGMTAILLFARDPAAVERIEEAECGFGAADMGNKGAVGLRVTWSDRGPQQQQQQGENALELAKTAELTFVATHLAAMEWNLKKRNANWRTIVSGLTFANPKEILSDVAFPGNPSGPTPDMTGNGEANLRIMEDASVDSSEAEEEASQPLLHDDAHSNHYHVDLKPEHHTTLQDLSIYKQTSHLFVAGDLNYRISTTTPPPGSAFPSFDAASKNYFPAFLPRDQLTQERLAGRAFHGMSEAPITFGPTYKYDVLNDAEGATNEAAVRGGAKPNGVPEVPWRFASHRWPGWCDRVLFLDLPEWASGRSSDKKAITVRAYDSFPVLRSSDHRPVFLRVDVPIVGPETMRPPTPEEGDEGSTTASLKSADPRVTIPVPVDVHAWERRAAARNREILVGWSAFFFSTAEGALIMATILALTVGGWWWLRGW
ncbi:DNase I-like protein [Podospora didyma]|uniref:DNase I-like protein n=1 Tax=Podospora didyma TaxID=330526 RepID=A0AAE0P6U0_9PEZI|nr:DNase I-like protein [Podospora didyma]